LGKECNTSLKLEKKITPNWVAGNGSRTVVHGYQSDARVVVGLAL